LFKVTDLHSAEFDCFRCYFKYPQKSYHKDISDPGNIQAILQSEEGK